MSLTAARPRSVRVETSLARVPRLDWLLLLATAALLAYGVLLVWSATADGDAGTSYLKKQLVNAAIGIVLALLVASTDHRWVRILTPLVYVASLVGLLLVLVMGSTVNGSRSWIFVGPLSIQPAEFAKLAVIVGMALVVAERAEGRRGRVGHLDVVGMLAVAALPAALILLQPDLGTMLVLSATVFGVIAVSGAPRRWLVGLFVGAIAAATAVVRLGILKDYQIDRFMAFTNPGSTRAAPATTPSRLASRSATAGSSGKDCSTARRRGPASSPSSTPTSSSPSRARSSAWSVPGFSSHCLAWCCGGRW